MRGVELHFIGKGSLVANWISFVLFILCFLLLALNAHKGLDITDHSFYLLWAKQPENVSGSVTHFGYVTKLLYTLVYGSIDIFRLAGVIVLSVLGLCLAASIGRYWQAMRLNVRLPFCSLAVTLLCGSLFYYNSWLDFPSYNWLALVAVLVTVIGLLFFTAHPNKTWLCCVTIILIAAGGALAFIAKPTTAMVLAAMALTWSLGHCPNLRGLISVSVSGIVATLFLGVFAYWNFGSVDAYLKNLSFGLDLSATLGGGHTLPLAMWRAANSLVMFGKEWIYHPLVMVSIVSCVVITLGACFRWSDSFVRVGVMFTLFVSLTIFLQGGFKYFEDGCEQNIGNMFLIVVSMLIALSAAVLTAASRNPRILADTKAYRYGLSLSTFLAVGAFAPALGTNNDFVEQLSYSAVFLAGAVFIALNLLVPINIRRYISATAGLLVSALLVVTLIEAYEHPYRLPTGISRQDIPVTVYRDQYLEVDSRTASYIRELRHIAYDAGWESKSPLIDMTGGSPGAMVILEARIPGAPWLLGNYPGSDEFAEKVLGSVSASVLTKAWILTAPHGERRLGDSVLLENGIGFPHDYKRVGSVESGHRSEKQILWKPINKKGTM